MIPASDRPRGTSVRKDTIRRISATNPIAVPAMLW